MEGLNLKIRVEALKRYERMLKKIKTELGRRTVGSDFELKRYIEAYEKEAGEFMQISTFNDFVNESLDKNIILFGNFRTDNCVRDEFLIYIKKLNDLKIKFQIAFDFVPFSKRKIVASFVKGKIKKDDFVKSLTSKASKDFKILKSYLQIVDFAKENNIPILPVDFDDTGWKSLNDKDEITARRLSSFYFENTGSKLLVLAPDSWIAKGHLPLKLKAFLREKGAEAKTLRIFSGSDKIYLKLARSFKEENAKIILASKDTYVLNTLHPVARYKSFFNYLDRNIEISERTDFKSGFKKVLSAIDQGLGLGVNLDNLHYKLYSNYELRFLEEILGSKFFKEKEKKEVLEYISMGESYFIPYEQIIYLDNFSLVPAAEEGSHYLRYILAGVEKPKSGEDKFYISVINEALAFMASKIIVPERKPLRSESVKKALKGILSSDLKESMLLHTIGYDLGNKLYERFKSKKLSGEEIPKIFRRTTRSTGESKKFYLNLLKMTEK